MNSITQKLLDEAEQILREADFEENTDEGVEGWFYDGGFTGIFLGYHSLDGHQKNDPSIFVSVGFLDSDEEEMTDTSDDIKVLDSEQLKAILSALIFLIK